jgi:hypothetical protein
MSNVCEEIDWLGFGYVETACQVEPKRARQAERAGQRLPRAVSIRIAPGVSSPRFSRTRSFDLGRDVAQR